MGTVQNRKVSGQGAVVTYTLIRKQVKNINLSVKSNGEVIVSAHRRVPEDYIDDFVRSKIPFIMRAMERLKEQADKRESDAIRFADGESVPYLGESLRLAVRRSDRKLAPQWIGQLQSGELMDLSRNPGGEAVFRKDGCLYIYADRPQEPEYVCRLYEAWQKIQAERLCTEVSRRYYPYFEPLGIPFPLIKIRKMKSRWGSCIPAKHKITFNSELLAQPLESVEYVVVHEFAHFVHPDHSKEFYAFVAQILPDYRERREKLKMHRQTVFQ